MERQRVRFTGRVQGVGFRATARAIARRHPITGWVRNEPDGSVVVEAQGRPHDIDAFLAQLRSEMGPLIARQDAQPVGVVEGEGSFEVQR